MTFKTIYLTGAPATGKSSTVKRLQAAIQPLEVWEYGARLTAYIQARDTTLSDQTDLRARSASIVTPQDIQVVDQQLLDFVTEMRLTSHVIVDTHAVTKEDYGFRITAFSIEQIRKLNPDEIWVLYTAPEVAQERIEKNAQGRQEVSLDEARMHTLVQASVAATYGIATGRPVYLFDSHRPQDAVVTQLSMRLS